MTARRRFAVDSWFVDNGQPAVILPLANGRKGLGPMSENGGRRFVRRRRFVGRGACCSSSQGWNVIGLFMKNWEDDDSDEYCSSRQDLIDVMSVADRIGIDVEVVNFAAEVPRRVFAEFLREYQAGGRRIRTSCAILRSSSGFSSTTP